MNKTFRRIFYIFSLTAILLLALWYILPYILLPMVRPSLTSYGISTLTAKDIHFSWKKLKFQQIKGTYQYTQKVAWDFTIPELELDYKIFPFKLTQIISKHGVLRIKLPTLSRNDSSPYAYKNAELIKSLLSYFLKLPLEKIQFENFTLTILSESMLNPLSLKANFDMTRTPQELTWHAKLGENAQYSWLSWKGQQNNYEQGNFVVNINFKEIVNNPSLQSLLALQALRINQGELQGIIKASWYPQAELAPTQMEQNSDKLLPPSLQFSTRCQLQAKSFTAQINTISINNLSSTLSFPNCFNLQSFPAHIEVNSLSSNDWKIQNLHGVYQFLKQKTMVTTLAPDTLAVQNIEGDFVEGKIRTVPFEWRFGQPVQVSLALEKLNIAKLLQLVNFTGLNGEGKITGYFPLKIDKKGWHIGQGQLKSTEGGRIQYDAANLTEGIKNNANFQLLLNVLKNFHYEQMTIKIAASSLAQTLLHVDLKGKNPDYYGGVPIAFQLQLNAPLLDMVRYGMGNWQIENALQQNH